MFLFLSIFIPFCFSSTPDELQSLLESSTLLDSCPIGSPVYEPKLVKSFFEETGMCRWDQTDVLEILNILDVFLGDVDASIDRYTLKPEIYGHVKNNEEMVRFFKESTGKCGGLGVAAYPFMIITVLEGLGKDLQDYLVHNEDLCQKFGAVMTKILSQGFTWMESGAAISLLATLDVPDFYTEEIIRSVFSLLLNFDEFAYVNFIRNRETRHSYQVLLLMGLIDENELKTEEGVFQMYEFDDQEYVLHSKAWLFSSRVAKFASTWLLKAWDHYETTGKAKEFIQVMKQVGFFKKVAQPTFFGSAAYDIPPKHGLMNQFASRGGVDEDLWSLLFHFSFFSLGRDFIWDDTPLHDLIGEVSMLRIKSIHQKVIMIMLNFMNDENFVRKVVSEWGYRRNYLEMLPYDNHIFECDGLKVIATGQSICSKEIGVLFCERYIESYDDYLFEICKSRMNVRKEQSNLNENELNAIEIKEKRKIQKELDPLDSPRDLLHPSSPHFFGYTRAAKLLKRNPELFKSEYKGNKDLGGRTLYDADKNIKLAMVSNPNEEIRKSDYAQWIEFILLQDTKFGAKLYGRISILDFVVFGETKEASSALSKESRELKAKLEEYLFPKKIRKECPSFLSELKFYVRELWCYKNFGLPSHQPTDFYLMKFTDIFSDSPTPSKIFDRKSLEANPSGMIDSVYVYKEEYELKGSLSIQAHKWDEMEQDDMKEMMTKLVAEEDLLDYVSSVLKDLGDLGVGEIDSLENEL